MDDIGWSRVEFDVLADLCELGLVQARNGVLLPSLVHASEEPHLDIGDDLHDDREESVDEHRLGKCVTSHRIPTWNVVRIHAVEDASSKCERLREVSLNK